MIKEYPSLPEPYTIELELTNNCNARCLFCSNFTSKRQKGFMNVEELKLFLFRFEKYRDSMWLNSKSTMRLPKIVLGGLGEPLLHPQVFDIIKLCKEHYYVQLITNGYLLTKEVCEKIIQSRIDSIAISLHSLDINVYENLTKLPFDKVFENVKYFLDLCKSTNSDINVQLWRVHPPYGQRRESVASITEFNEFVSNYPFLTVLGPSEPWSRDGAVSNSLCDNVNDDSIWCHKIWFTMNLAFNGDVVICCNDFNRISVDLGNAFTDSWDYSEYVEKKRNIIKNHSLPICLKCKRWRDDEYNQIIKKYFR